MAASAIEDRVTFRLYKQKAEQLTTATRRTQNCQQQRRADETNAFSVPPTLRIPQSGAGLARLA
jgi:hypothetical protein